MCAIMTASLLKELCPNGVKYKKLDIISERIFAGGTPRSSNSNYYGGNIPWLRSGEVNFNVIKKTEITIQKPYQKTF